VFSVVLVAVYVEDVATEQFFERGGGVEQSLHADAAVVVQGPWDAAVTLLVT